MGNSGPKMVKMTAEEQASAKRIAWAMPSWCIDNYNVTPTSVDNANASWRYAMSGESPPFKLAKAKEVSLTPLVFFYNQFYYFLFELLPDTKVLFTKGMKGQGRMLANVIKYIITNLKDSDETSLHQSLEHLTRVHNLKGITPDMYSVMGMCLVHTVRICTGNDFWTDNHHEAWVHIYSKMMSVIIPIVISGELPAGEEATTMAPLEYYKQGNLNAEADASSTSKHGSSHTPSPPVKTGLKSSNTCPALGSTGAEDIEMSGTMKGHLAANAAAHLDTLSAEAQAQAAQAAENKYKVLTRILSIAQRVEAHLREIGVSAVNGTSLALGSISGHQLLNLLISNNWVSDANGASMAASYFLQLGLMARVGESTPATLAVDAANAASLHFPDNDTIYTFTSNVAALTPPTTAGGARPADGAAAPTATAAPAGSDLIVPPHPKKKGSSTEFAPKCFVSPVVPTGGILHALSPSPMPNLANVSE